MELNGQLLGPVTVGLENETLVNIK